MPEAPVNENHCAVFWKNDIGLAGKIPAVQPEPVPETMKKASDADFRSGIRAAYGSHVPAALLPGMNIGHVLEAAASGICICIVPTSSKSCRAFTWGTIIRATSVMTGTTTLFPNCLYA
jgi:hypothetical protein